MRNLWSFYIVNIQDILWKAIDINGALSPFCISKLTIYLQKIKVERHYWQLFEVYIMQCQCVRPCYMFLKLTTLLMFIVSLTNITDLDPYIKLFQPLFSPCNHKNVWCNKTNYRRWHLQIPALLLRIKTVIN